MVSWCNVLSCNYLSLDTWFSLSRLQFKIELSKKFDYSVNTYIHKCGSIATYSPYETIVAFTFKN